MSSLTRQERLFRLLLDRSFPELLLGILDDFGQVFHRKADTGCLGMPAVFLQAVQLIKE